MKNYIILFVCALAMVSCQSDDDDIISPTPEPLYILQHHTLEGTIGDMNVHIDLKNDFSATSKAYAFFSDGEAAERGQVGMHWDIVLSDNPKTTFSLHLGQPEKGTTALTSGKTTFNAADMNKGLEFITSSCSVSMKDKKGNDTTVYAPDEEHPLLLDIKKLQLFKDVTTTEEGMWQNEIISYRYKVEGTISGSMVNQAKDDDVKNVSLSFRVHMAPME